MEKTLKSERVFDGKLLKVDRLEVKLDNGKKSVREIVRFPEVVVVIAADDKRNILCVKQFRKPVEGDLLEAIAGKVDAGETPVEAAKRELMEETGYEAKTMVEMGTTYPTPGYSTEIQHYFVAVLADKPSKPLGDGEEKIECKWMSEKDLVELSAQNEPVDGKLITGLGFLFLAICKVKQTKGE